MKKEHLFFMIILLSFINNGMALNNIDKYILNNGVTACNGESPNCRDFYRKAVELNDYREPISPNSVMDVIVRCPD